MALIKHADILIVEDELLIAKNMAKKLDSFGYNVVKIVSTGQAAIDFIAESKPDLILMDIAIKGEIDGIETASKIREIYDVPIIFITAYANDETLDRAAETGCYAYLIKPCREKELQATVKITLSKHQKESRVKEALQSSQSEHSAQQDDIYQDDLTGLPNKLFLRDVFDYLLSAINQDTSKQADNYVYSNTALKSQPQLNLIAVFNISLDRWSKIKNFLTKDEQNCVTKEVARRLKECVANSVGPGSTIYLKPDNFVVLLTGDERITSNKQGHAILNALKQGFVVGDREIYLSPIVGFSLCPKDSKDITELLEQGYLAREYALNNGGSRCQAFTYAFNIKQSKADDDLHLESELHRAVEKQEFELFYQPKVDIKTNQIVGSEALIRWNHPKMGIIGANRFIPLAEDIGLIKPIGRWVLSTACAQMQTWIDAGLKNQTVSVNISGAQFKQSDLFHQITQVLFETSLEPQYLELELTETILVKNIKQNVRKLNLLKKLGIKISLDDFGTGFSSLGYLQQFPFDTLKIDSCFIRNIHQNQVNSVITKAVVSMAHQLNLEVVAEGVEVEAELDFLKSINCDTFQGYFYSRPLSSWNYYKLAWEKTNSANKVPTL